VRCLQNHFTTSRTGFAGLKNGELLDPAEPADFDVLLTVDRNPNALRTLNSGTVGHSESACFLGMRGVKYVSFAT